MKTYLRHRIWNVVEVKELIALEYLDFEGKYKDYSERHDFWELCYAESGDIEVFNNGERIELKEGDILLISPYRAHSYRSVSGNKARTFVACFESSSAVLKVLADTVFASDATVKRCMECLVEESESTFKMNESEHLEALKNPNFGGQQAIIIQLEYLLIKLIRTLSSYKKGGVVFLDGENFYSDLSKIVIKFFEEHIRDDLSLDDICRKVNYSRSFLCKTFKKQTGETLIGCFNRMRAEEAARLLTQTDWSITKIAGYLGFSEIKYFGALFRRYMLASPSEYRRMHCEEGAVTEE